MNLYRITIKRPNKPVIHLHRFAKRFGDVAIRFAHLNNGQNVLQFARIGEWTLKDF